VRHEPSRLCGETRRRSSSAETAVAGMHRHGIEPVSDFVGDVLGTGDSCFGLVDEVPETDGVRLFLGELSELHLYLQMNVVGRIPSFLNAISSLGLKRETASDPTRRWARDRVSRWAQDSSSSTGLSFSSRACRSSLTESVRLTTVSSEGPSAQHEACICVTVSPDLVKKVFSLGSVMTMLSQARASLALFFLQAFTARVMVSSWFSKTCIMSVSTWPIPASVRVCFDRPTRTV